jgi:hypothetical protein
MTVTFGSPDADTNIDKDNVIIGNKAFAQNAMY